MTEDRARARRRVEWLAASLVLVVYGGLALTVDFPEAAVGIQSDEATYYLMGHSLAADGDLEYRREDLERTYREFPTGPAGIYLNRGNDVTGVRWTTAPPFVTITGTPDPDRTRLYYGKSFAYPLAAAPFVWLFGTNGFLVLNAILLAAAFLAACTFLSARSAPTIGLLLASSFVFATVVPVYFVWIAPEIFNFSLGLIAYCLWLHKHALPHAATRRRGWLDGRWTDVAAGALIGLLTFSKVTSVLLLAPMVSWWLWRRAWWSAAATVGAWAVLTLALFGANVAVSGDWNYQGGDRATCYGTFPFETPSAGLEVCAERARDEGLGGVIFDPAVFWTNLRANSVYVFVGRNSGLVAYFFPAVFGVVALLAARRRREAWQWFVLGGIVLQVLTFIISQPYSYFGGGGSVGNRYFMGAYGICLFLLPPVRSVAVALIPWIVGALFMARLVLDPFQTSIHPGDHAKSGLFRLLPVELTNVNDLPINTDAARVRLWYGETDGHPGFQIYYLDDHAYLSEADGLSFWIRGESMAELLLKASEPHRRIEITLSAGPVPTVSDVRWGDRRQRVSLAAGQSARVQLDLPPGFPYKKDREAPAYVWVLSVSSSAGFVPALLGPSEDVRFLGVRVRPVFVD